MAFCPCLKKKDSCLEVLAGWLPDDDGAQASSLASAYKKANSASSDSPSGGDQRQMAAVEAAPAANVSS